MTGTVNSSEDTWPGGKPHSDAHVGRATRGKDGVGFHRTSTGAAAHVSGDPDGARYVTTAPLVTAGPVAAPTSYCQRP